MECACPYGDFLERVLKNVYTNTRVSMRSLAFRVRVSLSSIPLFGSLTSKWDDARHHSARNSITVHASHSRIGQRW